MTSATMVKDAGQIVARALEAQDWVKADRGLEYLAGAWLRGRVAGEDATAIAAAVDDMRMTLMTEYDVDQDVGPVELAWMLAGVSNFLSQAANPPELTGADTASRILEILAGSREMLKTGELARLADRAVATVARELPRLRDEGLVSTISSGRSMLNEITAAGRERCRIMGQREPVVWPTSLARHFEGAAAPMVADDIMDPVQPNDVASIRAFG